MPGSHLQTIDWVIIAAYLALALGAGVVLSRRAGRSTKEFFISGRSLPWWIAGTSMVATSFASDTPLLICGWVRKHGLWYNWIWWCFAISHLLAVFYFARLWRRAGVTTDVELAEIRYSGRSARVLRGVKGVYFAAIFNTIAMTWVLLGMSKILGVTLGVEKWEAVALCAGVAVFYAALSGFWGVVITDLFQFVIAMVGSVALAWIAVGRLGGLGEVISRVRDLPGGAERLSLLPVGGAEVTADPGLGVFGTPIFFVAILLTVQWWSSPNSDGGGLLIQRMSACKDEKHSVLAMVWFCIAHYALRPWPWILVALVSLIALPDLKDPELAYPRMMVEFLPPGLFGLMIASLLGAFMSTIDSQVNLASAYFVNDVYRRFIWKGRTERHYVLVARAATVLLMGVAGLLAWKTPSISDLFTLILALASGLGAVLILRWFWWRVSAWSELAAMVTSVVVAGSIYLLAPEGSPWKQSGVGHGMIIGVTVGITTVVWLLVTFLTRPVPMESLVAFYKKVRPPGAWGPVARAAGIAPPRDRGALLRFAGGLLLLFGLTFGIGKALLLEPGDALLAGGCALLGALLLGRAGALEFKRPGR